MVQADQIFAHYRSPQMKSTMQIDRVHRSPNLNGDQYCTLDANMDKMKSQVCSNVHV